MAKFKNKYRIESARAQWWDYGWNGAYFITICTARREHFFGEIVNGEMILSPTGIIADILWHEIPRFSPFVELGEFVVMPNHIHGILILDKVMQNTTGFRVISSPMLKNGRRTNSIWGQEINSFRTGKREPVEQAVHINRFGSFSLPWKF